MEIRGLLSSYDFPGDDIPIVKGSALAALEGTNDEIGTPSILKLMEAVDNYIPQPDRPKDKPFLMPIEDVFSISGRGTVVTGRVESGIDRKRVVSGKSVSVRVDIGGLRIVTKKKRKEK